MTMAKDAKQPPAGKEKAAEQERPACSVCGVELSLYNPGPNCWQHTIGHPWRGPSAKPRYD